jgi:uncharacterized repeat protein (TIGR01451 family)
VPDILSGTKTVSGIYEPGNTVTYTVVLTNNGLNTQPDNPGAEFTDVLPAGLSLVSANASSGMAVSTIGTKTVTWDGSIQSGGSVTITIYAAINNGTEGTTISNQGSIAYDADGNGSNESTILTDDPNVAGNNNPTNFMVSVSRGWTTTGDAGVTEDESNPAKPTYTNFTAAANSGSPAGTYVLRYNITAIGNLNKIGAVNTHLKVRFRDDGAGSRVTVSMMRANIFGGVATLGTIFDSDTFASGSSYQTQELLMPAVAFDFTQNTYWLEVTLTKTDTTNQPGFGSAQINQQ